MSGTRCNGGWAGLSVCPPRGSQKLRRGVQMAEDHDLMKCPLCEGQAEVTRLDLIKPLTDPELSTKLRVCLARIRASEEPEAAAVAVLNSADRDFQKDVHNWNPQVPMWRRSPKE